MFICRLEVEFCAVLDEKFTYRSWNSSGYKGDGQRGFCDVRQATQPTLAHLVVVPVHGREGNVSEKRGPQTPPQGQPALFGHCWTDALGQLPVRLLLRLQFSADQLQRTDHRHRTHFHTEEEDKAGHEVLW